MAFFFGKFTLVSSILNFILKSKIITIYVFIYIDQTGP